MGHYTHLSVGERQTLSLLLIQKVPMTSIALTLGRNRSSLIREVARHSTEGNYDPFKAEILTLEARHQSRKGKIASSPTLRSYVITKLKVGWSPEQISGRLKRKKSKYYVCAETIYRFIYGEKRQPLRELLRHKHKKRGRKRTHKKQICRFGNRRIITERPKFMRKKLYGHWEGDLIEFKGNKKCSVTTLVERKTKVTLLIKNENKSTQTVMGSIQQNVLLNSPGACSTVTFDQGSEFARHSLLEKNLRCKVFYCHRSSPWEKGLNENTNGRLRRFLPDKTDVESITQQKLDEVCALMNNTPRKCLDFRTPKEVFYQHFSKECRTWFRIPHHLQN